MPRRRRHTVGPKVKEAFVAALADTGNVQQAARQVGFSRTVLYAHARQDPAFAQAWQEAIQSAMDTVLEAV